MTGYVVLTMKDMLRIEQTAVPRAFIAAEVFTEISLGWPWGEFTDGILKIHGINGTVIYRVGEKVPGLPAYYAEWPD